MNLYKKYILPHYINWAMRDINLNQHRVDLVTQLSGVGVEIGFGSGLNLPYYTNVNKVYALEPSNELYEISRRNIADISFAVERIPTSAEHIPLPDNFLDFALSTWSLCTIPNPDIALKEIFRVLKSGGKFSFIEHGKSPNTLISSIQDTLTPISKCFAGGCHLNRDIEHLIRSAGFEMLNYDTFSHRRKPLSFMYKGTAIAKK